MTKRTLWVLPLVFCVLFAASPAYCSTYYVDGGPNGNDSNDGSINHPFKTIMPKAYGVVVAGDTVYLRGGTHTYTTTITISKSGTSGAKYYMSAYPGERPVLDFSGESSGARGMQLNASYWYIKGIDFYKAGDNGMIIEKNNASYNRIELCNFYENLDSGLQLANGAANNEVINCDSYYNCDVGQGNADGFAPKLTLGTGNYFYGCRSWQNSDDAYDCYLTTSNEINTTFENCWAFKAGYLKDGSIADNGNGNGFKMGSSTNNHNITLKNCLSFQNKAKGFDQNHNKGSMTLYNCTAYNNGGYNYSIYEALASGKTATLTNCVHFTGSNNLGTFVVQTTNSWRPPFAVNSADFVSIDPAAAYGARKADGNLPDITFMHLAAGSDLIDGGTNVGLPFYGTAPDLGCFEYVPAGSPPGQASGPVPSDVATNVGLTQDLSWTAGSGATSHDVYFGTAGSPPFIGNQAGTTYNPGTMTPGTTYYWRIDEKNAGGTTTGTIWNFTTVPPVPGSATDPNPANLSANVSLTAVLSWTAGSGAASHDVYFGTDNPPSFIGNQAGTTYNPGTLVSSTTYYWRIDEKNAGGTVEGTLWSFTAEDILPPTPDQMTWEIEPNAISRSSITMTAAPASDSSGVEYYFANVSDSNHDSGWQDSNVYTDINLAPATTYYYQVVARDKSVNHNETGWSDAVSATTLRYDCTSPIISDLTGDCQVDLFDYAILADEWVDGILDLTDMADFALDWLTCNRDPVEECWQ